MGLTFDEERDRGLASLLLRHGHDLANKRICTIVERELCKRCGEGAAIWGREGGDDDVPGRCRRVMWRRERSRGGI
jgi:hypothetical protein